MVIGIGEVIDSRSLFPEIINNLLLPKDIYKCFFTETLKLLLQDVTDGIEIMQSEES